MPSAVVLFVNSNRRAFFVPVVPAGQARIRVQLSAAHQKEHIDKCVAAFRKVGEKHGILGLDKQGIVEKYGL